MVIQFLLACHSEAGGDDGQCVRTHFLSALAHVNSVLGGDAAGACVDGDTAAHLVDGGFQDFFLLLQAQDVAFAVGAEGEDAVYTALDLALHLVAQLGDVDGLVSVHGGNYGRNDTLDFQMLHNVLSFYFLYVADFPGRGKSSKTGGTTLL